MKFSNLRLLLFFGLFFLFPTQGRATPPPGGPVSTPSTSGSTSSVDDYQSLGIDRHIAPYSGVVMGMDDAPIRDVLVMLFIDGELAVTATTDGGGLWELKVPKQLDEDVTKLLWFLPPDPGLLPKEIVLAESKSCRGFGLISRCVPRATMTPGRQFRVYLFDTASRIKELNQLDCLPLGG